MPRTLPTVIARAEHIDVLIEELAARLAAQRVGVRLYDGLLRAIDRGAAPPACMTRESVETLRAEEAEHVELARDCLQELGGDPASVIMADEVYATACLALPQWRGPERNEVLPCLQALLRAELADEDGWTVLVALARLLDRDRMGRRFERALVREKEHLRIVRRWARQCSIA